MKRPGVLIIMDGYGLGEEVADNAIYLAETPVLDRMFSEYPNTYLMASGPAVGLPEGQIGNSEVGHVNIGAGRIVFKELPLISAAIKDGSFLKNPVLCHAMEQVAAENQPVEATKAVEAIEQAKSLHLIGLVSDGGVHSHNTHLYALLEMARDYGVENVYIHAFLDGRDVAPASGADFVRELRAKCAEIGAGEIATVMGRYYAMDRDNRWERVERAYNAMVCGDAEFSDDPVAAIERSYANGVTDEFMEPVVCLKDGAIKGEDSVMFFNFRPDRARELTYALTEKDFDGFSRRGEPIRDFTCMTQYDEKLTELPVAFPREEIDDAFGGYISELGLRQFRIAETEKYAHVTFFFNGGREAPIIGEDRMLIQSPKEYATYDLIPEMEAYAVADEAVRRIESELYDVVIINFANCDMVGHTGNLEAAIAAVAVVDECVGRVADAVLSKGGFCLITADHGNCDIMRDEEGQPHTAHTLNDVPFIVVGCGDMELVPGGLSDIVPTMLELMELDKPALMTGESLIRR